MKFALLQSFGPIIQLFLKVQGFAVRCIFSSFSFFFVNIFLNWTKLHWIFKSKGSLDYTWGVFTGVLFLAPSANPREFKASFGHQLSHSPRLHLFCVFHIHRCIFQAKLLDSPSSKWTRVVPCLLLSVRPRLETALSPLCKQGDAFTNLLNFKKWLTIGRIKQFVRHSSWSAVCVL